MVGIQQQQVMRRVGPEAAMAMRGNLNRKPAAASQGSSASARRKRKKNDSEGDDEIRKSPGAGAGAGAEGHEKHNQFLWAQRMGHQNQPRWGLFKQVCMLVASSALMSTG